MTEIHETGGNASGTGTNANLEIVSVDEILNRRVVLAWYESVAIVAGLCSTLVEDHATGVPAPGDVVLSRDGHILVSGHSRSTESVALPRLLHELLAVTPPPTSLRLFVLNAISSDGDKSPAVFGQALEYYERPGRAELIQAVRQRCLETPIPEPGSASAETEEPEIEAAPERPSRPGHRRAWAVAATLVVCASAVAVVVAAGRRPGSDKAVNQPRTVSGIVAQVAETGREVARGIAAALTSVSGNSHEVVSTPPVEPPAAPAKSASRRTAARRVTPVVADASVAGHVVGASGVPDVSEESEEETTSLDVDATAEVFPPRLLDPVRLPHWAHPAGSTPNVLELDISESGAVQRVRLITPATSLTDMMILSAAKTWVFAPATQDGQPISYRLTLNWVFETP
ncbi:MAG TPA: hypothetical protein VNN99_14575 [Vicinamibacterales bacterium]|nr:hypothetical protein [Vicinamibacterales bacterium]